MKHWQWIIMMLWFTACNINNDKKIAKDQAKYSTTADSKLFFKNVRQYYYDREVPENTKLEVFRFAKRNHTDNAPVINLSIVNNWMYDEAYILIEPNSYLDEMDEIHVQWADTVSKRSGEYVFKAGSKEMHFQFASEVYESIQSRHQLKVKDKAGNWLPLFPSETDRDNFRKTMVDYYRLVNLM